MCHVLSELEIQSCIKDNRFMHISVALLYGWKGYSDYTEDELIREIQDSFTEPKEIKKLLIVHNERVTRERAELYASIKRRKKESLGLKIYKKIKLQVTGNRDENVF